MLGSGSGVGGSCTMDRDVADPREVEMGSFMGGSAPAMARQVCDGYTLLTANSLKRLSLDQMVQLEFEMDKKLRLSRGEQPDLNDQPALQERNRRISRIEGQIRILRHSIQQRRMGRM
jgi:hypothetical protein